MKTAFFQLHVFSALLCLLTSCATQTDTAAGSFVRKRNGQKVSGEIKRLIAFVYKVGPLRAERSPQTAYGGMYLLVHGKDVRAIDENGLLFAPGSTIARLIAISLKPIGDLEAFDATLAHSEGTPTGTLEALRIGATHDWTAHFDFASDKPNPIPITVIGEFRKELGKGQIVPAIEVSTKRGIITIRTAEIAELRAKLSSQDFDKVLKQK